MIKCLRKACGKIMNMTYKTMEKVFGDEDLRKIFGGMMIGGGVLCLKDCFKNNIYTKAGLLGVSCLLIGFLEKEEIK